MLGTGKSTLVNVLIDELGLDNYEVAYACYTGKAALVLREKGMNGITLHKLLFNTFLNPKTGVFCHVPKEKLSPELKIIVVDEVSMVSKELWRLLLSHHIHIVALGDNFQLPPIGGENEILQNPHIFLNEIIRQKNDSEIIEWANKIRQGEKLKPYFGKDVRIFYKKDFDEKMLLWADQILVGTNANRKKINKRVRTLKGYDLDTLNEGEKLICLRNYWEIINDCDIPLVNGLTGTVKNIYPNYSCFNCDFLPFGEDNILNTMSNVAVNKQVLTTGFIPTTKKIAGLGFDFGYAITTHKSQGSEWDRILIIDDSDSFPAFKNKWLYTAITRAKKKVIIII